MGDDLGEDWESYGMDGDESDHDEGTLRSAQVEEVEGGLDMKLKSKKKKKKKKGSQQEPSMPGKKRGRDQLESRNGEGEEGPGEVERYGEEEEDRRMAEEAKQEQRAKKKAKMKALKAKLKEKKRAYLEAEQASQQTGDGAIEAHVPLKGGEEAAGQLWAQYCKVQGDAVTPLEKENPWISASSLANVEGFGAHTLAKMVGFIKASMPDWKKRLSKDTPRGSPAVLIVCSGARRCVKVIKAMAAFRCHVLKLFAKHMDLEEQKKMLQKACFPLAVGTPARMRQLAAMGALHLDKTSLFMLDVECDVKGRSVLNMDGVAAETMGLLAEHVKPMMPGQGKGKLKIAVY